MNTSTQKIHERRQAVRDNNVGPASISFQDGGDSIDCDVIDCSDYGARIRPSDISKCPDKFVLTTYDGDHFDCLVVWRHDERIGVKFFQPAHHISR